MSHLAIADLNFVEAVPPDRGVLKGSGISMDALPTLSLGLSTGLDTASLADYNVAGNLQNGFKVNIISLGSAAGAAAAAVSLGGVATVYTYTKA